MLVTTRGVKGMGTKASWVVIIWNMVHGKGFIGKRQVRVGEKDEMTGS